MDSTGAFATVVRHDHNGKELYNTLYQKEYTVELGTFKKGLPPELMTKYLSIADISSTNIDDSTTVYTAGKFNNSLDAEIRKKQLIAEGLPDAKVVYKQGGKFYNAPAYNGNATNTNTNNNTGNNNTNNNTNNTNNNTANNNNTNNNNNNNNNTNNNTTNTNNNTANNNNTNNTNNTNNNTANNNTNTNTNNTNNNAINNQGVVLRVQLGAYKRFL